MSGLTNLKMVVGDSAAFWQRDFATELPNLEHLQFETFGEEIGWGTWNFRIDLRFTDFGVCGEHKSLPSEDEEKWSVKNTVHTRYCQCHWFIPRVLNDRRIASVQSVIGQSVRIGCKCCQGLERGDTGGTGCLSTWVYT